MNGQASKPESTRPAAPLIALIAGEESGDQLGADLIVALRALHPDARFVGIGGQRMRAQGFVAWHDIGELSLFGLSEVVRHLPRLLRLRRRLTARLREARPDVVVGIDAPDFNLGVELRLKRVGVITIHYVSPSVWAWRERRVEAIGHSARRVLCLFPMEPPIYAKHGIDARFVGHPLADRFSLVADRTAARTALGLPPDTPVLAVLPGSRLSELSRLGPAFLAAAARVAAAVPGLRIVIPAANPAVRAGIAKLIARLPRMATPPLLLDGHAHDAMLASDVVLLASGTATLEAMLAKRPMVVGYRVAALSYHLARALRLLKTDVYSLPNVLARADDSDGWLPVPEFMQGACTPEKLAAATLALFQDSGRRERIVTRFEELHRALRGHAEGTAAERAAQAIDELLASAR